MNVQREVEQLVNGALAQSHIPWWEWSIPENKVISNDLKASMLGYDPADFQGAGYQAYTELLHADDYERTMQAMRDHLEGTARIYQIDYRILRSDGNYTWYMDRGCIIERDADGKPLRLRGVVIDLGETLNRQARERAMLALIRRRLPTVETAGQKTLILCDACKKLRITKNVWVRLNRIAFEEVFYGEIEHAICPGCTKTLYPEFDPETSSTPK